MRGEGRPRAPVARILRALAAAHPDARCGLRHRNAYELLVACVLSAQCSDATVNRVTPDLFARFPAPEAMAAAAPEEVEPYIARCGLHRTKARHLVAACRALVQEHGGAVPRDREALERLPGVGRKTAGVVLATAFGEPALPVDTHVFRVANRLGLVRARSPEEAEAQLMARIPRRLWISAHHWLIHHGRRYCHARRPRCGVCPLAGLCAAHAGQSMVVAGQAAARAAAGPGPGNPASGPQ